MAFKKYPYSSAWGNQLVNGFNFFEPNLPPTAKNERFAYDEALYTLDCALFTAFESADSVFIIAQWTSESSILELKALVKQKGSWSTDDEKLHELKKAWTDKNEVAVLKVVKEQPSLYGLAKAIAESQIIVEANGLTFEVRDNVDWKEIYQSALVYIYASIENDGDTPSLRKFKGDEKYAPLKNAGLRFDLAFTEGYLPIKKTDPNSLTWDSLEINTEAFGKVAEQAANQAKSGGSRYQSKALSPDERLQWLIANQSKLEELANQYNLEANSKATLKLGLAICGVNIIPDLPLKDESNSSSSAKDGIDLLGDESLSSTFRALSSAEKQEVRNALAGKDLNKTSVEALDKALQALLADDFLDGETSWHKLPEML